LTLTDETQKTISQADQLINSLIKQSVAVSQGQATTITTQFPKFTVTESGLERLSSEDRACLEEIERGSQLTAEERELLENSKKDFQVLDFQDFDHEKTGLLSQDLVNQALEYDPSDENIKAAFSSSVAQSSHLPDEDSAPLAVIANPAFGTDVLLSTQTPTIKPTEANSDPTQSTAMPILNPQQTLQIILQDDQGKQQILTIDQKSFNDSLQKIHEDKAKSLTTNDDPKPSIVCSLSDITVQDGKH
jgi:hypothetical protein